jgi:hypothetical protein
LRVLGVAWEGSSWSARGEARTNEMEADERRRMIGGEELACVLLAVLTTGSFPGSSACAERVSQTPIRRRP